MARQVNMHEAKTHLSRLVDEAAAGEEIVIARNGKPAARLVKMEERKRRPGYGAFRGQIEWLVSEEEMEEVDREIEAEFYADDPNDPLLHPPPAVDR
jgi:prevent-host-death family protein